MTISNEWAIAESGPLRHVHAIRFVERYLTGLLSVYDRALLSRIIDVTIGWDRLRFKCSLACLISGKAGDGREITTPVGMSLSQAKKSLSVLKQFGIVRTSSCQTYTIFSVDCSQIVTRAKAEFQRLRKTSSPCEQDGTSPEVSVTTTPGWASSEPTLATECPTLATTWPHIEENSLGEFLEEELQNSSVSDEERASPSGSPDDGSENLAKDRVESIAQAKVEEIAAEKRTAAEIRLETFNDGSARFSAYKFSAFWKDNLPDGAPMAEWGARERGQAINLRRAWGVNSSGFGDFIVWTLANWQHLRTHKFRWMKDAPPPTFPQIGFYVHFDAQLFDAYMDRAKSDRENDLKLTYFEMQLAKGVPIDEIVARANKAAVANAVAAMPRHAPMSKGFVRPKTPPLTDRAPSSEPRLSNAHHPIDLVAVGDPAKILEKPKYDEEGFRIIQPRAGQDVRGFDDCTEERFTHP